jgi:hypothetical protein
MDAFCAVDFDDLVLDFDDLGSLVAFEGAIIFLFLCGPCVGAETLIYNYIVLECPLNLRPINISSTGLAGHGTRLHDPYPSRDDPYPQPSRDTLTRAVAYTGPADPMLKGIYISPPTPADPMLKTNYISPSSPADPILNGIYFSPTSPADPMIKRIYISPTGPADPMLKGIYISPTGPADPLLSLLLLNPAGVGSSTPQGHCAVRLSLSQCNL